MKWFIVALLASLAVLPGKVNAQQRLDIGKIAQVDDNSPTVWGMSGFEMFKVSKSDGHFTPIMRTETYDARTVEILSRTQAPRLTGRDIRVMSTGGHEYVVVRRYLLLEVKPQDAAAAGTTTSALAQKWASAVRRVLPQVAPLPAQTGI